MEKTISKSKEFIKLCKSYGVDPENVPEIISFEDACKVRELDPDKVLPDVSDYPERHQEALLDLAKLFIIHEAFNLDPETNKVYEPDWNNSNERKWTYWWDMEKDKNNPTGFRFDVSDFVRVSTRSTGGSRLCNRNEDIDIFIAKHFTQLFRNVMVFSK